MECALGVAGEVMTVLEHFPHHRTALLVVDLQHGFCHPDGRIGQAFGPESVSAPGSIVPLAADLIVACRASGVRVWATQQVHYPEDQSRKQRLAPSHLERNGVEGLCARGTWDAELMPEIDAALGPEDEVIVKHRSSAFYGTNLELQLRICGIQVVLITGTTTSFCVDSTIRDAYARDFDVVVVEDAVADSDLQLHEAVLATVRRFHGTVVTSSDVFSWLDPGE